MMRYGTIFSGIEGFGAGFDRAGMSCAWQIEIDKDATKVLERRYPNVPRISDVRNANRGNLIDVDIIAFGWPCTDLSVAGLREGLSGKRSGLFFEAVRIISELRPAWIVAENVPGLFSSYTPILPPPSGVEVGTEWEVEEDSDCENVIASLTELGYCLSWRVCDGQFWGVAQRRERVFFVGHLGADRGPEVFPFAESMPGDFEARGEARRGIAAISENDSGIRRGGYRMTAYGEYADDDMASTVASRDYKSATDLVVHIPDVSLPLIAGGNDRRAADLQTYIAHTFRGEGFDASEDGTGRGTPLVFALQHAQIGRDGDAGPQGKGYQENVSFTMDSRPCADVVAFGWNKSASQTMRVDGEAADALQASPQSNPAIAFTERTRSEGRTFESQEELAYALTNPGSGGRTHSRQIAGGFGVRRLTPRECERLQSFPDDWTLYGPDDAIISDSARYRMLGNAVITNVSEWIGRRILEQEAL
jgi:DNA (cytosine-5)-methyltransferase 1